MWSAWQRFCLDAAPCEDAVKRAARVRLFCHGFYALLCVTNFTVLMQHLWWDEGDFRPSKIPALFERNPVVRIDVTRTAKTVLLVVGALASGLAALGVGRRVFGAVVAVTFAVVYFSTAIIMYQHYYMVSVISFVVPFLDCRWHRERVWPLRAIAIQMTVVYAFTAFNKYDERLIFLSGAHGSTMSSILWVHQVVAWCSGALGVSEQMLYAASGVAILCCEATLAALLPAASLAPGLARTTVFVLGTLLHVSFEVVGKLRIKTFSYYMLCLYVLFLPDALMPASVARWLTAPPPSEKHE